MRFLPAIIGLFASFAFAQSPDPQSVLTVKGNRFLMNGQPFDMWGIRVASGTQDEKQCRHLIDQLDEYLAHGVNTVTVFYMGCRGGNYDPFAVDGSSIDAGHQQRMDRIIRECARRKMVVVVGIFYQAAPFGLKDAEAVKNAVRTVTTALKSHRNIIINVVNEQNSGEWARRAAIYDFREPENVIELCRIVRKADPGRLVGGGGYDHGKNPVIGRSPDVDVLLFDTAGPQSSAELYRQFVEQGVKDKPIVNVETFGGWTKQYARGVFSDEVKRIYLREVDAAAAEPGLSVFFHNNPWCQHQTEPMRYDLGGDGTEGNPGIRWYFEHVKRQRRP